MSERQIRGHHVAMMFGGAFAIIIAVNVTMAVQAVRTFPGLEVKNSYVASQSFDAERREQEALGWTLETEIVGDRLILRITDPDGPVLPEITAAQIGRPTNVADDRELAFVPDGTQFVADVADLHPGSWYLRVAATAEDGTAFRQRLRIEVRK